MADSSNSFILQIHPKFQIQRQPLDPEGLIMLANEYIKSGEVYEQEIGDFLLDWLDNKDFIIVQTSGSTGTPKKIKMSKKRMIYSARATGKFFKAETGTTALLCLSAKYIAGKMMLVRAMELGWKIDLVPPKINPLDSIYRRYDFCAMVPMQLDNSLNRLHLLKKLLVGGGSISGNLIAVTQQLKTKIFETYGMTETMSHVAARRINPKKKDKKEFNYFKAFPNVTFDVDERNCLIIKAPNLVETPLVTNDVVELKTYKKFSWKGRYDHVVNSGGIKLFPEEIESKLQILIGPYFFVAGIPDDVLGEMLVLFIEDSYQEHVEHSINEGIHHIKSLAKYEIPKKIIFIPKFQRTTSGKIQRKKTVALIVGSSKKFTV